MLQCLGSRMNLRRTEIIGNMQVQPCDFAGVWLWVMGTVSHDNQFVREGDHVREHAATVASTDR